MKRFLDRPLTLKHLTVITINLPQIEPFQSAVGFRHSREALLVRWEDKAGRWGLGECSCRPDPFFSHEFVEGSVDLVNSVIFPMLSEEGTFRDLVAVCRRIRGWNFAKAAVLDAVSDMWLRNGEDDPVEAWPVERLQKVPVGISLGLYDTTEALIRRIEGALADGYRRVKLKIKPGLDPHYLAGVRDHFPDAYIGCDANGSFCQETLPELVRLSDFGFAMIEQPFAPDRLDLCARLKNENPALRICLDESVYECGHLLTAIALGAIDELNIKPGRVGGMANSIQLAEICRENHIPVWVGGMFETGIGRANNLRFAACFPNAQAHDLSPSKRYFVEDLVCDPLDMEDGYMTLPAEPPELSEINLEKYQLTKRVQTK